jgi:16S rRNA G966 N2-methylase RsmD
VAWCRSGRESFDVIFLDPPYAFEEWPTLLSLVPAEFVVIESNREISLPERFALHRTYRYGTTLVTMARRQLDRVEMVQ